MCKNLGVEEGGRAFIIVGDYSTTINVDTTFLPLLDFRSLWITSRW